MFILILLAQNKNCFAFWRYSLSKCLTFQFFFFLDVITSVFKKTSEREIRKLLENKIKNSPGQKVGPGRGTAVDSNRGNVGAGASDHTVHTPDDSDEDSFM